MRNLILCFGEQEERLKTVKGENVNVYVYTCIPECMCIHTICMQEPAEAKRTSAPLQLELHMVVGHCVAAGN